MIDMFGEVGVGMGVLEGTRDDTGTPYSVKYLQHNVKDST